MGKMFKLTLGKLEKTRVSPLRLRTFTSIFLLEGVSSSSIIPNNDPPTTYAYLTYYHHHTKPTMPTLLTSLLLPTFILAALALAVPHSSPV